MALKTESTQASIDQSADAIEARRLKFRSVNSYKSLKYLIDVTGRRTRFNLNNLGTPAQIAVGATTNMAWADATPPTVVANSWVQMAPFIISTAGAAQLVYRIIVHVTGECQVGLSMTYNGSNLTGSYVNIIDKQYTTTGGKVVFDFTSSPLRVDWMDDLRIFYSRNSTVGVNWSITGEVVSVSSDINYDAPFELGGMGDSFLNVQATGESEYSNNGTTVTGVWTVIVQKYLLINGIDTFRTNIGQGGSDINFWLVKVRNGLFRRWRPDIVLCNLGINDSITSVGNGLAKLGYKEIISEYFKNCPNGCFVANNIEDTDVAAKLSLVTSGAHTGKTFLAAIRDIMIEIKTEFTASNPTWDFILAPTIPTNPAMYSIANTNNFVETSAGSYLHPNAALGQPKIANVVNTAISTSRFFLENKTT